MTASQTQHIYRFADFVLDVRNRRLCTASGKEIKLSSRAFDTLVELVRHRGEILGKNHLLDTVWHDLVVEENNINQAISLVRKALGDSTEEPRFIKTVSGKGFCFIASILPEAQPDLPPEAGHVLLSVAPVAEELAELPAVPSPHNNSGVPWFAALKQQHYLAGGAVVAALALLGLMTLLNQPQPDATPGAATLNASSTINEVTGVANFDAIPDSIAVLPFANLNQDSASELFVLGLHDELISQLAKLKNLNVISRESVLGVAHDKRSIFEMAALLKVESLLTGSILVSGADARINLQMLDADTGVALWGESYGVNTHDLTAMIDTQSEIALRVVQELEIEIGPREAASLALLPTSSFDAYRYYQTAKNSYKHQDNKEKWVLVRKALELDPDYADAHLLFASINSLFSNNPLKGFTHEEHLRLMHASIDAYIRLEPYRSEGHALKAVALGATRDWNGVHEQIQKLQQLGVAEADMKYVGMLLLCLGDFRSAISIYQHSLLTEPANLYTRGLLMAAHEMAGNRDLAQQEYALGNELMAVWWGSSVNVLLALGRNEPFVATHELVDMSPELLHVLNNVQTPVLVKEGIRRYQESSKQNSRDDVYYSALAAHLGDTTLANTLLRQAMEKVSTSIFWAWLPVFDATRQTPEFRQLLRDFGLVDYWQQHGWPEVCQPHEDSFSCDVAVY